eukprot:11206402-Lingulodinium_polyedra.AAC.1
MVVGSAVGSSDPRSGFCCGLHNERAPMESAVDFTVDSPAECTVGPVARWSKKRGSVSPDQTMNEASEPKCNFAQNS